ncbi:MAG: DUF554 domain-containing protein [Candidatus Nanopelagicales bacterium]|nr:DUF554 domain-containing protein [Candidatus Nanopelagicales bacterium]
MFIGSGTLINVIAILIGSTIGVFIAHRLNEKIRDVVTDGLGLATGMIAVLTTAAITNPLLTQNLGSGRPVLIVLASVVVGGILGTLMRIEERLEIYGDRLKARFSGEDGSRFTEGFVAASLLFCVGAMAVLGPITDGLGGGNEILVLKSTLDFFASIAFASVFGWGVAASALTILLFQGSLTLLGYALGNFMSEVQVLMLTATGGLLLLAISLRLLNLKQIPVGNMLPALVLAPLLAAVFS